MGSAGIRQSRQRAFIYQIVASTKRHPTADWIYEKARARMPKVSLGTVYRNLQVLERAGKIRAIDSWGRATRYDADLSDHYHFLCEDCGSIFDLEKPAGGDESVRRLVRGRGFSVTSHRLEFHGCCPDCANKKRVRARQTR